MKTSSSHRVVMAVVTTLAIALVAVILTVQQSLATASAAAPAHDSTGSVTSPATTADGLIADGTRVTPFDDVPAVTGLDDGLREALQSAARAAASEGVQLRLNSGWRSPDYQRQLLQEAVAKYGSAEEAARWVATADTSEHVTGEAADIGPWKAAEWLGRHGAQYGLCRVYANEAWHFELRVDAPVDGCPRMYADASERRR